MKSFLFTLIVFVIFITNNQAQTLPEFRGKVKSITETIYNSSNQKLGEKVSKYNQQGLIIEHIDTDVLKNISISYSYSYDVNNNLIEQIQSSSLQGILYISKRKYDDKGKIISYIIYKADSTILESNTYEYNAFGKMLKYVYLNADSTLNYTEINKYDDKGNIISKVHIPKSQFNQTYLYVYDSRDSIVEAKTFDNNGTVQNKIYYVYDNQDFLLSTTSEYETYWYGQTTPAKQVTLYNSKGNIIETKWYYGDSLTLESSTKHFYDSNGRKISTIAKNDTITWKYNAKGILVNYSNCQNKNCMSTVYNDFGDVIYDENHYQFNSSGLVTNTYEYDSKMNWITKVSTNKVSSFKTIRVIEYW